MPLTWLLTYVIVSLRKKEITSEELGKRKEHAGTSSGLLAKKRE